MSVAGGDAIEVSGKGSSCQATKCQLLQSTLSGAVAANHGIMIMRDCMCEGSKQLGGYVALHGATITLINCTSEKDVRGCYVKAASLFCEKILIYKSEGQLVKAECAADVALVECRLLHAHTTHGAVARSRGTMLTMRRCVVTLTHDSSVRICDKARGRLSGCWLCRSKQSSGLTVTGEDTVVEASKCTATKNRCVGACASPGPQVTITDSVKTGNGTCVVNRRATGECMYECPCEFDGGEGV